MSFLRGIITWSVQDDRMNMSETWHQQTLIIEYDQNHDNDKHYLLNMTKIETNKPYETDKLWLHIWVPPYLRAWYFFLVEEQSDGASEASSYWLWQLSKPTPPAYFLGVKLMFVGVMNFGQIKKIRFVVVNIFRSYSINKVRRCEIFWSYSNQFLVILIRSS